MALFAALLPPMHYSLLSSSDSSILRPELLSSTAILLLPRALRLQLTLYAISAAIHSSARQSRIYRHLPPVWWLNAVFNAFLIHAFLADQTLFPKAYRKILLVVILALVAHGFSLSDTGSSTPTTSHLRGLRTSSLTSCRISPNGR
jgi:hypothetical protein